jgi:hypothetical protein
MTTEDNEMIQTPWGKKRWGTIRQAFEQRDELLEALKSLKTIALCISDLRHNGQEIDDEDWSGLYYETLAARELIYKATGEPVMAA